MWLPFMVVVVTLFSNQEPEFRSQKKKPVRTKDYHRLPVRRDYLQRVGEDDSFSKIFEITLTAAHCG